MVVQPYLFFDGKCEEAVRFYQSAVGAKVEMMMKNKEAPDQSMMAPGTDEKILHAQFRVGDSVILASDGHCAGKPKFDGFSLSMIVKSEAEADKAFAALSAGGQVRMPLSKTFFSPRFGMLADKFGVGWMVYTERQ